MKIKWYGHSAFRLTTGEAVSIIVDPYQPGGLGGSINYDRITDQADVVLISHDHEDHNYTAGIKGHFTVIRERGSYNIKGVKIEAVPTSHGAGMGPNMVFVIEAEGLKLMHLGDIGHTLPRNTTNQLGKIDVLMIPVDGVYTLDLREATQMINDLKPSLVFPMHFKTEKGGRTIGPLEPFVQGKQRVKTISNSEIEVNAGMLPDEAEIILLCYDK